MNITIHTPVALRGRDAAESFAARIARTWADWRLYRRTLHELERMSDRELEDIGLARVDLGRIARESVYGS